MCCICEAHQGLFVPHLYIMAVFVCCAGTHRAPCDRAGHVSEALQGGGLSHGPQAESKLRHEHCRHQAV